MLGIEPLVVTILETGTIELFEQDTGRKVRKINPPHFDVVEIEHLARIQ